MTKRRTRPSALARRADMRPVAVARIDSTHKAALFIVAVVSLQIVLVSELLNPRTFFVGDSGVKYLQAHSLVVSGWRSASIPNPAPRIDPAGMFSVLAPNQFVRRAVGAPFYGAYSELFTVPVSVCLALFGIRGMYLVAILAMAGTMILTYRLSVRLAPQTAWLTPLLIGAGSPMLFYSVDLWEHTLATLLATASVVLVATGGAAFSARRFAVAGVALGAAIAVREELYALLPAGLLLRWWVAPRQRLPAALAAYAGAIAALVPHWLLKFWQVGHPERLGIMRVLDGTATVAVAPVSSALAALGLILPPLEGLLPLAFVAGAAWWLRRSADVRDQRQLWMLIASIAVLWASINAMLVRTSDWPSDVCRAFPVVLFLFLLPPAGTATPTAWRTLRMILAVAAVFAAGVIIASAFNPGVRHPQWGPRFLMPVFPLLAAAIAFTLEHSGEWTRALLLPRWLPGMVLAVLTVASVAVQAQGVRKQYDSKEQYERLLRAVEAVHPDEIIVSDIWWFGGVTAAVLSKHESVAVNVSGTGSLSELLERFRENGVTAFTFVTGTSLAEDQARALARAGWSETQRRIVPLWFHARLISYRREAASAG